MTSPPDPKGKHTPEPFVADFSEGHETGLYLALLELIDEGLIITGDELVLEANSAACRLLERDYGDIAGKPLANIFPSERAFLEARERLMVQGEMRGCLNVSLPGGRQRALRFIAAARLRPGVHALIISPDIIAETYGDKPEYEDHLWPRLAAALEQPVVVIDQGGRVAAANAAALRVFKRPQRQLIGHSLESVADVVEWPATDGASEVRIRLGKRELKARLLPGHRPGWQVLILPPPSAPSSSREEHPGGLASSVARAVERNQLEVQFQPLVDVRSGRISGGEALMRWNHPELGQIPFSGFMDVARAGDLMAAMGDWVLRAALAEAAHWPETDGQVPRLTVNVATEQLMRGDLADRVRSALAGARLPGERLELDFDEQLLNENCAEAIEALASIRALGVQLAIDDFGRGAASIPGLKRYPLSAIKLAPPLVRHVGKDEECEAIVEAITSMAEVLKLDVLARGVETREQQAFLDALGCHLQQGPLFGPPLSASAFRDLLLTAADDAQ